MTCRSEFPAELLARPELSEAQAQRELLRMAASALGVATERTCATTIG